LQEGRVVAYTSSKFTTAEYNYSTPEQELLALLHVTRMVHLFGDEHRDATAHGPQSLDTFANLDHTVQKTGYVDEVFLQVSICYPRGKNVPAEH